MKNSICLFCAAALSVLMTACAHYDFFPPSSTYKESAVLLRKAPENSSVSLEPGEICELAELEKNVGNSPEVLPALSALDGALAARELEEASGGPRIFAGGGYAFNKEPESVGSARQVFYDHLWGRVGIGLPLLGTWAKRRADILESEARLLTARQVAESRRAAALAALRSSYIIRWMERERRARLEAYLKDADLAAAVLWERMNENLLLPADYRTFLGNIAQAERLLSVSMEVETRARDVMRIASGVDVPPESLATPSLPRVMASQLRMEDFIRKFHPEVCALNDAAAHLETLPRTMALGAVDARLDVSYAPTRDFPGTSGDSLSIGLNLEAPLNLFKAGKAHKARASAQAGKARRDAELHKERLLADLRAAVAAQNAALDYLNQAEKKLEASAAAEKSARLRHGIVPGDTFEQHLRVRHDLLAATLEAYDAAGTVMRAQAEVLRAATDNGAACIDLRDDANALPGVEIIRRQTGVDSFALALSGPERRRVKKSLAAQRSKRSRREGYAHVQNAAFKIPQYDVGAYAKLARPASFAVDGQDAPLKTVSPSAAPKKRSSPAEEATLAESHPGQDFTALRAQISASPKTGPVSRQYADWAGSGAYVWDAAPFLDASRRAGELQALNNMGLKRILISFTSAQVRELAGARPKSGGDGPESASETSSGAAAGSGREKLAGLVNDAHAHGIGVIWLLGDPQWILPEHRDELTDLTRKFKEIPFDGIHLDLEPDQLPGAKGRRAALAEDFLNTVKAVIKTAPQWPMGVSLHPRYLREDGPSPRLIGDLAGAGVCEIAVMAYNTRLSGLKRVMNKILSRSEIRAGRAGERFGNSGRALPLIVLAQSFERAEPESVSHYHSGQEAFQDWLKEIREALKPNLAGILIQSWEDYSGSR